LDALYPISTLHEQFRRNSLQLGESGIESFIAPLYFVLLNVNHDQDDPSPNGKQH